MLWEIRKEILFQIISFGALSKQSNLKFKLIIIAADFPRLDVKFDTVVMNPPFGTKNNEGIDMLFLEAGLARCSGAVYSFHKSSTRDYIVKR